MSYAIYALEDPRDSLIHSIGMTDDLYRRFCEHIRGSSGNLEKNGWIFECRQAQVMIIMRTLEVIDHLTEALERERAWIRHFLELGMPIENNKVAKSILKEHAKLARQAARAQKNLQQKPERVRQVKEKRVITRAGEDEHLSERVRAAWEEGCRSNRQLVKSLGITYYQAQLISKRLREQDKNSFDRSIV